MGKGKATSDDIWVIEVEFDIDFDDDNFEISIEELGLLDADFDEWLNSLGDEVDDDEDGDGEERDFDDD